MIQNTKKSTHIQKHTWTSSQTNRESEEYRCRSRDRVAEERDQGKQYECKRTENKQWRRLGKVTKEKRKTFRFRQWSLGTSSLFVFSTSLVFPLRKLFLICVHPGDGPNPGCERQQSSAGWRLLLEVPVYASLGGPSSGAGLAGQWWATAWRKTQLLPAQWRHSSTELEADTY